MKKSLSTQKRNAVFTSLSIMALSLGLTYMPLPGGGQQTVVVVAGTELQEPLQALEAKFEQEHPGIQLELKFQGSQDIVNRYMDDKNDFTPTVLIPANANSLEELQIRWQAQNSGVNPFYDPPRPIARTFLVAIAWDDRGKALFPNGQFRWQRLQQAMIAGNWSGIGGPTNWGSFDFVTTDPARSNSGQLTLALWSEALLGRNTLNSAALNTTAVSSLFGLVKRSVYQPPRSTDVLLQEFITRGPNDADVAMVYESIALHRWQQAKSTQGKPYQIYYFSPTIETTSTAAIVRRNVDNRTAETARKFVNFLTQTPQQSVFVQYGFRPIDTALDVRSVSSSPWNQGIPGAEAQPSIQMIPSPDRETLTEIVRLWERAN